MSALHQLSKYQTKYQTASSQVARPNQSPSPSHRPEVKRARKARTTPQQRQRQQQQQHRILAMETSLKLAVNMMISGVAIVTLFNIIPNRASQHEKLREVQSEVRVTEQRVSQLQTEFNRAFDSTQERQIAQEQTNLVDPNRTPIVWLDKKGHTTAQLPDR